MARLEDTTDGTKAKLMQAAGEVFGEVGFEGATVREICRRAGANVAAVNYHFGDKVGLYTQTIVHALRFAGEAAQASVSGGTPEDQLRAFVHRYMLGLFGPGNATWLPRLVAVETSRSSPVLKSVVKHVIRPTEARVRTFVSECVGLPSDDEQVRMCAHSIIGQCLHYKHAHGVLSILWPDLWRSPDRLERLTNHIVDFSLGGLREVKRRRHGGKG
jgi:TetR/AcrR family transcriptional regulator, regulator of cefoperazone and chloramphenicol sensitivity